MGGNTGILNAIVRHPFDLHIEFAKKICKSQPVIVWVKYTKTPPHFIRWSFLIKIPCYDIRLTGCLNTVFSLDGSDLRGSPM